MKPSEALLGKEKLVVSIVENHGFSRPRIFGSVLSGKDKVGSDLDLLVNRVEAKSGLISLVHLEMELSEILGIYVDVKAEHMIPEAYRNSVLSAAREL